MAGLLPVAAAWRGSRAVRGRASDRLTWTRLSGELRLGSARPGWAVLIGPRDADLLVLLALGGRSYDEGLVEHIAGLFHGVLDWRGLGPQDVALAIGAPVESWMAAGPGLRRVRRSAGAATAAAAALVRRAPPGVTDLLHDLRDAPEVDAFVDEQPRLLSDGSARSRAPRRRWRPTLRRAGARRRWREALHLERRSLYLRLRRIELLGVSLDDEDAVLGLHLALRARGSGADAPRRDPPPRRTRAVTQGAPDCSG